MNWRNFITGIGVTLSVAGVLLQVNVPTAPMTVLVDAGMYADCRTSMIVCPVHLSDDAVNRVLDAGLLLARPTQRYVKAATLAFDCSDVDGGLVVPLLTAFGVTQSGDPHLQVVQRDQCVLAACDSTCAKKFPLSFVPPDCVRAPADGGGVCLRSEGDGGALSYGPGNVFPASLASGPDCEQVECVVVLGDSPETL